MKKGLAPHEVRVVQERTELVEKITKLHAFMGTDIYNSLKEEDKFKFERQEHAMIMYSEVLLERINSFEGKIEDTVIPLTFGQQLVGLIFNPSGREDVNKAKQLSADLIDLVADNHNEITKNGALTASWTRNVLRTAAINAVVTAQMAVVKILTWSE